MLIATQAQERVHAANMRRAGRPVGPEDRVPGYPAEVYDGPSYRLMINAAQRRALIDLTQAAAPLEAPDGEHPLVAFEALMLELPTNARSHEFDLGEDQRVALLELVVAADVKSNGMIHPDDDHPLVYWDAMLADLPRDETEGPGCLHGFCL